MANTTIQGTGGSATITGFGAKLDIWTANLDFGGLDTTGFGDDGYGTIEGSLCGLSGSASGMMIDNTAPILAAVLAATFGVAGLKITELLLYTVGTTGYSFPAVISNVALGRPEDGKATVSFDFVSNGRITPT